MDECVIWHNAWRRVWEQRDRRCAQHRGREEAASAVPKHEAARWCHRRGRKRRPTVNVDGVDAQASPAEASLGRALVGDDRLARSVNGRGWGAMSTRRRRDARCDPLLREGMREEDTEPVA